MSKKRPSNPDKPAAAKPPASTKRRETLFFVGVSGAVAAATLAGIAVLPELAPEPGMVGKAAPGFVLPVVSGGDPGARMALGDLLGKPVILDFWASWCEPCRIQGPILERLAKKYRERGLTVLGVNVDDTPQDAAVYAKREGLTYPILVDLEGTAQRAYEATNLPTLVIVDRDGRVAAYMAGLVDETSLDDIIATLL